MYLYQAEAVYYHLMAMVPVLKKLVSTTVPALINEEHNVVWFSKRERLDSWVVVITGVAVAID